MRTLGNFEIQPDAGAHVESVQPGDEQKRKLEPISEDILDRDTGKDASGAHLTEDPTKKRLPSLADREELYLFYSDLTFYVTEDNYVLSVSGSENKSDYSGITVNEWEERLKKIRK